MRVLHATGIGDGGDGDRVAYLAGFHYPVGVGDLGLQLFPRVTFAGVCEEHVACGLFVFGGCEFDRLGDEDELLNGDRFRFAFGVLVGHPGAGRSNELFGKVLRKAKFLGEFFHA